MPSTVTKIFCLKLFQTIAEASTQGKPLHLKINNTTRVAEATAVIEGMNYQWAPVKNTPLQYLSMAGGASVYLKGSKIATSPADNQIHMQPLWSDDLSDFIAPSLSRKLIPSI